jgi:hypothetical protein
VRVLGVAEDAAVRGADHGLRTQEVEVDRASPPVLPDQHDRDRLDLARLHQRQRLEQLVERAEAAGEGDHRAGTQQEVEFPQCEVAKAQRQSRRAIAVGPLRHRQLDVQADRDASRFKRAAIGGFHDPGAAAGHEGCAAPAPDHTPELTRNAIVRIGARGACASHDEDRLPDTMSPQQRLGPEVLDLETHGARVYCLHGR